MQIYESGENYLETIYSLQEKSRKVRAIDVARELNLSRPSISRAMRVLHSKGYININTNKEITLTPDGEIIAKKITARHKFFYEFLLKIGVSNSTALSDACKLEHALSEESFCKLTIYAKKN